MAKAHDDQSRRTPYENAIGHACWSFLDLAAQISNLAVSLGEELSGTKELEKAGGHKSGKRGESGSPISVRAIKTSVALLLSSMLEGWANFLAELALQSNVGLEGSPKVVYHFNQIEIDCLAEQRTSLNARTAEAVVTKNVYIPTLDKLAIVPRLLGKQYGCDFVLERGGSGWQKVQILKSVRDKLVHPKLDLTGLLDEIPTEIELDTVRATIEVNLIDLYTCAEGMDWYLHETMGLLRQIVKPSQRFVLSIGSVEILSWLILSNLSSVTGTSKAAFNREHPAPVNQKIKLQ